MISCDETREVECKLGRGAPDSTKFTIRVLQDGRQFGEFNTRALGEEYLMARGWRASKIKGAYYKGDRSATVVPWSKPLPLEELER